MYLGEIPKKENILISFDFMDRHFDFSAALLPDIDKDDRTGTVYSEPVFIRSNPLRLDERCKNYEIRFLNQRSGRTHLWKNVLVHYESGSGGRYIIKCENDSVPENRRRAVRIAINGKSECTLSDLEGRYPCTISDISVTGVGLNIDVDLAEKNPLHRIISTHFLDEFLGIDFKITARCIHFSNLDGKNARCGCEIISVKPSLNEYINLRQTHRLARLSAAEIETLLGIKLPTGSKAGKGASGSGTDSESLLKEYSPEEVKNAGQGASSPAFSMDISSFLNAVPGSASEKKPASKAPSAREPLFEGALCPICEEGKLHLYQGSFECDVCGSILEDDTPPEVALKNAAMNTGKSRTVLKEGGFCPVCEEGKLHFNNGAFECSVCGSILE